MNEPCNQPCSGIPEEVPLGRYVQPSDVDDILFEQLNYLVAHDSHDCRPGCPDCMRLVLVKDWLLKPFRSAVYAPPEASASAG